MKERDHFGDLAVDRRIILKWSLKIKDVKICTRLIWFRIGPSDRLL
jgi:hypothetical protein